MLPIERLVKSNTTDNLWLYILSLLRTRPVYGWEIPGLIEREFGFRPGKITPYRVLYRLEMDRFVSSTVGNRRRVYRINEKGVKELRQAAKFLRQVAEKIDG